MLDNRVIKFGFSILTLIFIFLLCSSLKVNADTIYLKNGRSIEGLVKMEDEDSVELEVCSGTVKFRKSEIERIEKSTLDESLAIREKCERQKIALKEGILKQQKEEESKPKKVEFSSDFPGIVLNVTLNKKVQASLVLDTGASVVVLRKNIAEKLGINLDKVGEEAKLILADGRRLNGKYVILESIKVENVEAENIEAAIMLEEVSDTGFGDGLLGMSFLKRFNFKIDQKEKRLILEKL